jgi:hypothetical protein
MAMAQLPYENSTSGDRALGEIQKILAKFGCDDFGSMVKNGEGVVLIQFTHRGRTVSVKASFKGYAQAWMKAHPLGPRTRTSPEEHRRQAERIGSVAVYSILRDWIKGQLAAVETGILSFEGAFLGQLLIPSQGVTIEEYARERKLIPAANEQPRLESKGARHAQ